MYLQAYIDGLNRWAPFSKKAMIPKVAHLTPEDKSDLAHSLSADLSPENLCCDGELTGSALRQKTKQLMGARKELEALGVKVPAY
jgi:hypothetical protein